MEASLSGDKMLIARTLTYGLLIDIFDRIVKSITPMTTTKISSKYHVAIPKEIRQKLKLKPGQKLQMIELCDRIALILPKKIKDARGFLKGIDTNIDRGWDI